MGTPVFKNRILPYLLLLPSVVLVTVFFLYPAAQSMELSLYRVHRVRNVEIYVGLENFQRLFESTTYLNSLEVTAKFVVATVLFALAISLALAVGASQPIRGFGVYRTLLIWTYALSPAIAGLIWALRPIAGFLTESIWRAQSRRRADSSF